MGQWCLATPGVSQVSVSIIVTDAATSLTTAPSPISAVRSTMGAGGIHYGKEWRERAKVIRVPRAWATMVQRWTIVARPRRRWTSSRAGPKPVSRRSSGASKSRKRPRHVGAASPPRSRQRDRNERASSGWHAVLEREMNEQNARQRPRQRAPASQSPSNRPSTRSISVDRPDSRPHPLHRRGNPIPSTHPLFHKSIATTQARSGRAPFSNRSLQYSPPKRPITLQRGHTHFQNF